MATLRNTQDIIKGGHLMVFANLPVDPNNPSVKTMQPIAFATSHSLSKQLNTQEISCKDFGDVAAVLPQNYSWTMQTDNLYSIDGYQKINYVFKNMEKVLVYFGETTYKQSTTQDSIVDVDTDPAPADWAKSGFGEQGYAYITALDVTASAGENATFSATFTGSGTLTEVTTTVPHNISMLYVGGDRASAAELEEYIIPDHLTAPKDTVVLIEPEDVTDKKYYAPYISCTANNGTPEWDMDNKYWHLTMPDDDVTITLSDVEKYRVVVGSNTESFEYKGVYGENRTYFPVNSYVYVDPTDVGVDDTSYTCQVTYTSGSETVSITPSWNTSYNYWVFEMPASEVTSRIYHN